MGGVGIGLSEAVAVGLLGVVLVLALPLPRGVLEALLAVRPGWILTVAAAATSLVPFAENAKALVDYAPREGQPAFEQDARWQAYVIGVQRAGAVGALLLCVFVLLLVTARLLRALKSETRLAASCEAMRRQATSANAQALAMMDESSAGAGNKRQADAAGKVKLEKLLSENVRLSEAAAEAEKEVTVIKGQAKAFQREHERLIKQIADLEKEALKQQAHEPKKDK